MTRCFDRKGPVRGTDSRDRPCSKLGRGLVRIVLYRHFALEEINSLRLATGMRQGLPRKQMPKL